MAFGGSPTRDTVWAGCIARTRYWMRNQLSVEMTAPSRIGTHADDELLGPLPGGGRVHGRLFLWLLSTCGYGWTLVVVTAVMEGPPGWVCPHPATATETAAATASAAATRARTGISSRQPTKTRVDAIVS